MIGKRSRMDCGSHLVSDNIREKNSVKQVSAYGLLGWAIESRPFRPYGNPAGAGAGQVRKGASGPDRRQAGGFPAAGGGLAGFPGL